MMKFVERRPFADPDVAARVHGTQSALKRPPMTWSPGMVPYGADETVYLVVDSFASGTVYRETEVERTDLETVISDLMTGQFNAPVRVVAFNTLEHWAEDVSRQIAEEIRIRSDIAGDPVPEHIRDFVESHAGSARQLAMRFGS